MHSTAQRSDAWPVTGDDLYYFNEGTHRRVQRFLGAHPGTDGTWFAVWAPNARRVRCIVERVSREHDPGHDHPHEHELAPLESSGVWAGFGPGVGSGDRYVFVITGNDGYDRTKSDPMARACEPAPSRWSIVHTSHHRWNDGAWMAERAARQRLDAPMSVYEVHLGSFLPRRDDGTFPGYREIGERLAAHALACGFTHVELLPIMEHPFYGSWGYQTTGYFAPTSRFGTPDDLKAMIDHLHANGIGVLLDWVPSHFPTDEHGLARFDGTSLYEHADPKEGFHPDWNSAIFNYGRHEVRSFLISSALWWLEEFHADGLRVDAVASMLYRDYSRREGEWVPNTQGGRENLEAIDFLRQLNAVVYAEQPDVVTVAEESTAWPGVSRPTYTGGLGFGFKWDMGWMHDTLHYLHRDPVHRSHHHGQLTFRGLYYTSENYVLPLSHDEVVHGKGSLYAQMPGDDWQRRANLRLLLGMQVAQPGKSLLFAGGEIAQPWEWDHEGHLPLDLLDDPRHEGVRRWVADLNRVYRTDPALHEGDCSPAGFEWVAADDAAQSVVAWLRWDARRARCVLVAVNATPVPRHRYRVGLPWGGPWDEILNSDAEVYGGGGIGNLGRVDTHPVGAHGRHHSVLLTLPPLAMVAIAADRPRRGRGAA